MQAEVPPRPKKILLIDDDRTVLQPIERLLTLHNYQPIAASQWTEAVDALEHGRPDLVLLDLNMPTVDGPSLLKFMRKEGFDVPVMIVSAFISDQIKEDLTPFDVQAFISKPFTIEDLKKQIERVLGPPANSRQEASASKGAGDPSPDLSEKLRAGHVKSIPLVGRGLAPVRPFDTFLGSKLEVQT